MILYSILSKEAHRVLVCEGKLRATDACIDTEFVDAYRYMVSMMKKRVGEPPEGTNFPIWAWYRYNDRSCRPDLRCAGHGERGDPCYLVTFDIAPEEALLSDFIGWHTVLNDGYYSASLVEWETFCANEDRMNAPRIIRQSWARVFDVYGYRDETWSGPVSCIQATVWEIRMEDVVSVRPFVAR